MSAELRISVLTLIATVVFGILPLIIAAYNRHQKLKVAAKNFVIDNQREINFLPLCVFSDCLHPDDKHNRLIYTNFNKCDKGTQKAILRYKGINQKTIKNTKWVDQSMQSFLKIQDEYKLGENMLYDGAKYLHRAYNYKKLEIETIDPMKFTTPNWNSSVNASGVFLCYLDNYMGYKYRESELTSDEKINFGLYKPPMDLLYNQENLGNCPEKEVCFWIMRYICDVCQVLRNHNLINSSKFDELPLLEELDHVTYEDFYYYTLAILYNAFIARCVVNKS